MAGAFGGEGVVGNHFHVAGDGVGVGAVEDVGEGGATADGHQHVGVGGGVHVATFEAHRTGAAVAGVLAFAQSGNSGADLVKALNMKRKGVGKRGGHVAGGAGVLGEVGHVYRTFDVAAEVSATGVFEGFDGAFVDDATGAEFDFRTVVEARDAAEGEH